MNEKTYYVYIMASQFNGTTYTGITNNLIRRAYEHRSNIITGFTSKYNVHNLVYFEEFSDVRDAIEREKRIKKMLRDKKKELIESKNPHWDDLYENLA